MKAWEGSGLLKSPFPSSSCSLCEQDLIPSIAFDSDPDRFSLRHPPHHWSEERGVGSEQEGVLHRPEGGIESALPLSRGWLGVGHGKSFSFQGFILHMTSRESL